MKKSFLLFLFLCISVMCCFAEDNNTLPLLSDFGLSTPLFSSNGALPTQTSGFGFSTTNPVLSSNTLGLTRYADYERESFFDASKPVFQYGLIIGGGVLMAVAGILGAANPDGDYVVNILLFSFGLGAMAGGFVWIILD